MWRFLETYGAFFAGFFIAILDCQQVVTFPCCRCRACAEDFKRCVHLFYLPIPSHHRLTWQQNKVKIYVVCSNLRTYRTLSKVKWPPTKGWKGHLESPGTCNFPLFFFFCFVSQFPSSAQHRVICKDISPGKSLNHLFEIPIKLLRHQIGVKSSQDKHGYSIWQLGQHMST